MVSVLLVDDTSKTNNISMNNIQHPEPEQRLSSFGFILNLNA